MIILGVVLLILAALFTLGSVFNGSDVDYEVFNYSLNGVSVGGLFMTGLITGAIAMFALSLLLSGGARKRHKAVERKREVKSVRGQAETLEQENARLRDELAENRASSRPASNDYPEQDVDGGTQHKRGLLGR